MMTVLKIVCMCCKAEMGEKDGDGVSGVSHSICRTCWEEQFPNYEYPSDDSAYPIEWETAHCLCGCRYHYPKCGYKPDTCNSYECVHDHLHPGLKENGRYVAN